MPVTDGGLARSIKFVILNIYRLDGKWRICYTWIVITEKDLQTWMRWEQKIKKAKGR